MFYDVHNENMFTINLEDGREAPSKARKKGAKRLEFLVIQKRLEGGTYYTYLNFQIEFSFRSIYAYLYHNIRPERIISKGGTWQLVH